MAATPEHRFQGHVLRLAREVIDGPYRLRAFDRSRNVSGRQHLREAGRGIRKGTPDLELVWQGRSINIELKAGKNTTSDAQEIEMRLLREAGAYAGVAYTCADVVAHWRAAGVTMFPNADLVAMHRDAKLVVPVTAKRPRYRRAA